MKNNLRRLQRISQIFGADLFYAMTVYPDYITCQTSFKPELVKKLLSLKFESRFDGNGHADFSRGVYNIILT